MRPFVQQALVLELAVDIDQAAAGFLQQLHADGLIVDERLRAAIGAQHPAQHQAVLEAGYGVSGKGLKDGMAGA